MAPPLPPPGVPADAGLAPKPIASLKLNTELITSHDTPMLDRAAPLEHRPPWPAAPPNVLPTMYTGWPCDWLSTRMAPPPRSGPVESQTLRKNREFTTLNRPPRTKMAPPPPPSVMSPVELPSAKVRFWTVSRGVSWSWQCEVVMPWASSQVFM